VDDPQERISQRSENLSESILVSRLQSARKRFICNFNLVDHTRSEYGKFGRTGLFSGVVRSNLPLFQVEITRNETAKISICILFFAFPRHRLPRPAPQKHRRAVSGTGNPYDRL
jgi:hypothetical protein